MLTQERLKELLHYNPKTGLFIRIKRVSNFVKAGEVVGWHDEKGYIRIGVDGKKIRAHRLAFLYMTGEFPKDQVDHINRIKDDNRWVNLRHADDFINANNKGSRSGESNINKSGVFGVYRDKSGWQARGKGSEGKPGKYLGIFEYHLQACAARWEYEALECN